MLQKIIEPTVFIIYLSILIYLGYYILNNSIGNRYYKTIGNLCLLLGLADAVYLIPRMYAVLTTGIEDNLKSMGWGRMGNAVIITLLYAILYDAYNIRFNKKKNNPLDKTIYGLAIIRILISLLPGNQWFELLPSSTFAIARLIPLALLGILLALITYIHGKKFDDRNYIFIGVLVLLSIFFLEPRAFLPEDTNWIPIFAILRTIVFLTIILIEYKKLRDINVLSRY